MAVACYAILVLLSIIMFDTFKVVGQHVSICYISLVFAYGPWLEGYNSIIENDQSSVARTKELFLGVLKILSIFLCFSTNKDDKIIFKYKSIP